MPAAVFLITKRDDGIETADMQRGRFVEFAKADEHPDYTIVVGPVLVPDETDKQGDIISAEAIEEAAHDFLANRGRVGLQHQMLLGSRDTELVESTIVRSDTAIGRQRFVRARGSSAFASTLLNYARRSATASWRAFRLAAKRPV